MSDSAFRIKKVRESQVTLGGTLDSVHQSIVSSLKESTLNQETLQESISILEQEIQQIEKSSSINVTLLAKKHEELRSLLMKIKDSNQLLSYFSKNADLMLQYYGTNNNSASLTRVSEQNKFMKYLTTEEPQEI